MSERSPPPATTEPETKIQGTRASARWRHSLYARAALFIVLGSGTLLGAFAVLSSVAVDESVDRLLGERLDLARAAGEFVEHQLDSDLERLGQRVHRAIDPATHTLDVGRATDLLAREYRDTVFGDGVFLLDATGAPAAGVPERALAAVEAIDRAELVARARDRVGVAASPLANLGNKSVLVLLMAIRAPDGTPLAYLGALLQPAATNMLGPLAHTDGRKQSRLALVDRGGLVVASTDERTVFRPGDHDAVLSTAIRERRNVRGRCHSCHERSAAGTAPATDVLAFAPLPTLDLGVAVQQHEREALAPAFAVRKRLFLLGMGFVTIFVIFAWLSVRSVVLPIKRLTRAVRHAEAGREPLAINQVGKDELGELAVAIEMWRARVVASRERAEHLREARLRESEATTRHLEALQDLAVASTDGSDTRVLIRQALDRALALLGSSAGAIDLRYRAREFRARRGLAQTDAARLLASCHQLAERDDEHWLSPPAESPYRLYCHQIDDPVATLGRLDWRSAVVASLESPHGLRATLVLGDSEPLEAVEPRWISSLLRQVSMCAANMLLHEADRERRGQQQLFLHRVLKAQEDERRRIARELHDTLAQDLAAYRLEMERLAKHFDQPAIRARIEKLESRAELMLRTVRHILVDLRLSVLDSMGFIPALQWHLERLQRDHGIRATLVVDGEDTLASDYDTAVTLFRIFQESLLNVVQHAHAHHVFVTVGFARDSIELIVEDDGDGFDPQELDEMARREHGRGLGILGMEERASLLGGTVKLTSSPGEGTTVRVVVLRSSAPVAARAGATA